MLTAIGIILAILAIYVLFFTGNKSKKETHQNTASPTKVETLDFGECIWRDENSKPFFNGQYKIYGKPDAIFVKNGVYNAVEYKSRERGIYDSDINQAKAAALAARGQNGFPFKISEITILNNTEHKTMRLPISDKELYSEIEELVISAKKIKTGGKGKRTKMTHKCFGCGYKDICDK